MTPGANDLCVFAVERGTLEKRIDINFYLPKYTALIEKLKAKYGDRLTTIGQIADVICGPFGSAIKNTDYQESGIPLIRISNISKDGYMDYSEIVYISEELGNQFSRTQVKEGDIVISQRGSLGQCAVVDSVYEKLNISANIITIKNIRESSAAFIRDYILSTIGQTLLERNVSGQVQQKITTQDISELLIPINCDENQLVRLMEESYKYYFEKRKIASSLLFDKQAYVLKKVGIVFDSTKVRMYYATKTQELQGRLDADYYSPRFARFRKKIEETVWPAVAIGDICKQIVTGFAAGKQDQADDLPDDQRVPHLRPFSITPEGELWFKVLKYVPKAGLRPEDYCQKYEVLFNNTNSPDWVGKTTVFDQDVLCAASNHMTRITLKDGVNPYYIAAFFNVLLSICYWKLLCTNFNNQAGINNETLKKVRIPLPDKSVQDEIAAEIMRRRGQANQLRKEAAKEWDEAKAQFERELLGES